MQNNHTQDYILFNSCQIQWVAVLKPKRTACRWIQVVATLSFVCQHGIPPGYRSIRSAFFLWSGHRVYYCQTPGTSQAITKTAPAHGPSPRPSTSIVLNEILTVIGVLRLLGFRLCMIRATRVYKQHNIVSIVHTSTGIWYSIIGAFRPNRPTIVSPTK